MFFPLQSCWIPILRAMADGINDERHAVRVASVAALTHAISDRHALVVPAGVLVDILGDIVVPTVLLLAQGLVKSALISEQETEKQAKKITSQSRDEDILAQMLGVYEIRSTAASLDGATSGPHLAAAAPNGSTLSRVLLTAPVVVMKGTTAELLSALSDACMRHLKKLFKYPSFDKLWLRILHVLGYLLGAPHGFDHGVLSIKQKGSALAVDELCTAVDTAKEQLSQLMASFSKAGVFKSRGAGLLNVTEETLRAFKAYTG